MKFSSNWVECQNKLAQNQTWPAQYIYQDQVWVWWTSAGKKRKLFVFLWCGKNYFFGKFFSSWKTISVNSYVKRSALSPSTRIRLRKILNNGKKNRRKNLIFFPKTDEFAKKNLNINFFLLFSIGNIKRREFHTHKKIDYESHIFLILDCTPDLRLCHC